MSFFNFFKASATHQEKLDIQAQILADLHKKILGAAEELSMMRRVIVTKAGLVESCEACGHFTPPNSCEVDPSAPVKPSGWCPSFKRKVS